MKNTYILTPEKTVQPEPDMQKWGAWFGGIENRVVAQESVGGAQISTVFLGMDHNYGDGPPILWETMVFWSGGSMEQDRCSGTWADAEAMHQRMFERVKEAMK